MKPTPKESKKIHENYEKVVEHLIEEKYTEDREGADNIIAGMSEEWFNLIILKWNEIISSILRRRKYPRILESICTKKKITNSTSTKTKSKRFGV